MRNQAKIDKIISGSSRILVSGCLIGLSCNYKGMPSSEWMERASFWKDFCCRNVCFPFCPEQLGGLPTPRSPAELQASAAEVFLNKARVVNSDGKDVTGHFIKGAQETLRLAKLLHIDFAVLKSRSPSCGKFMVYDGTFSGVLVDGAGLTSYLLATENFDVFSETEIMQLAGVQLGAGR